MKIAIVLLPLLIAGCSSTGTGDGGRAGSAPDSPVQSPVQEGSIKICHVTKAQAAIGFCVSGWNEQRKAALLSTISSWAFEKDYYYPSDLERDSFKQRYELSDDQVSCLTERTCGVENESSL